VDYADLFYVNALDGSEADLHSGGRKPDGFAPGPTEAVVAYDHARMGREVFRCSDCGYGACARIAPERCPMCGGGVWELESRRSVEERSV